MIVDYYQNLANIEEDMGNLKLSVPDLATQLVQSQEQILKRKLSIVEKAEIKIVADKLKNIDEFKSDQQKSSKDKPIADEIIVEEESPQLKRSKTIKKKSLEK